MAQHIRKGDYGLVQVVEGEHAGRIGYYDDEADEATVAVVYVSEPLREGYMLIPHRWLRSTDVIPVERAQWKRENPGLVQYFSRVLP